MDTKNPERRYTPKPWAQASLHRCAPSLALLDWSVLCVFYNRCGKHAYPVHEVDP
jgi:hypothetical protein